MTELIRCRRRRLELADAFPSGPPVDPAAGGGWWRRRAGEAQPLRPASPASPGACPGGGNPDGDQRLAAPLQSGSVSHHFFSAARQSRQLMIFCAPGDGHGHPAIGGVGSGRARVDHARRADLGHALEVRLALAATQGPVLLMCR